MLPRFAGIRPALPFPRLPPSSRAGLCRPRGGRSWKDRRQPLCELPRDPCGVGGSCGMVGGVPNIKAAAKWVSQSGDSDQFTARVDKNVSDRQRIFARYTISKLLNLEVDPFHTHYYPLSVGAPEHFTTQQAVLDDSYSFSSSTIGDFNLSFIRQDYDRTPGSSGYDLTTLGWPAFMNSQVTYRELPIVHVQGIIGSGNQTGSNIHDHSDDYDFAPSISTIRGRHTLKFGMDLLVLRFNYIQNTGGSGIFNFTSNFTASDPLHPKGGNGFASFMLGDPASGSI